MIEQYIFLFVLALIWIIFAVVQDLRTTFIADWLTYSFPVFALAYRAFYSNSIGEWSFFYFGLLGFIIFFLAGNLLYYARVFAGGDAKLLFGIGAILPFENYYDFLFIGGGFILLVLFSGVIYTLVFSLFLALKNRKRFVKEFVKLFRKYRKIFFGLVILAIVLYGLLFFVGQFYFSLIPLLFLLWFLVYIYSKAVDEACMIKLVRPEKLLEGDWLIEDVKIGSRTIKKSFSGLTKEEIKFLVKKRKAVWIRHGVPFSPAFLIAFVIFLAWYF